MTARMPATAFGKGQKTATACAWGVLALLVTASPALAGGNDEGLDGVWRVTRHGVDCQSGAQLSSFPAIMQFAKDGLLTGYAVPPGLTPAMQSPDFGTWERARRAGNYKFRLFAYNYDLAGIYVGLTDVAGDLKLGGDGKTFTYTATIKFLDAADQLLRQVCGAGTGKRY